MKAHLFCIIIFVVSLQTSCQNKPETSETSVQNEITAKYENGQKKIERIYDNKEKDRTTYKLIQYNSDGSIEMKGRIEKLCEQGKFEWYYPNGNKKRVEFFNNGVSIDTVYCYYESGELKRRNLPPIDWRRESYEFYKSGELKIKCFILNSEHLDSLWTGYYKNGQIKETGKLRKGIRIGYWKYYDENGKITKSTDLTGVSKVVYDFEEEEDAYKKSEIK